MEKDKETSSTNEEKPKQIELKIDFMKCDGRTAFGFQKFEKGEIAAWWANPETKKGFGLAFTDPKLANAMAVAFQKLATQLTIAKPIIVPGGGKVVVPKPKITTKN